MMPVFEHTFAKELGPVEMTPSRLALPMIGARARLGFPSPADDFLDDGLDLNQLLIRNPDATFLYRADGDSMILRGILSGAILIVDRSIQVQNNDVVVAGWNGEAPVCKVVNGLPDRIELYSANPEFGVLIPPSDAEIEMFVVVHVINPMVRKRAKRVRPG